MQERDVTVESNASWVTVTPSQAAGLVWRCTKIFHRPPSLNNGKHNVFIWASINGSFIRNGSLYATWGWDGQQPGQTTKPAILNKNAPDPCGDFPLDSQAVHAWCRIEGDGYPSDVVANLHTHMDSDDPHQQNSWGHHSYDLFFERTGTVKPPEPPVTDCAECQRQLALLQALVSAQQIKIDAVTKLVTTWTGD